MPLHSSTRTSRTMIFRIERTCSISDNFPFSPEGIKNLGTPRCVCASCFRGQLEISHMLCRFVLTDRRDVIVNDVVNTLSCLHCEVAVQNFLLPISRLFDHSKTYSIFWFLSSEKHDTTNQSQRVPITKTLRGICFHFKYCSSIRISCIS